MPRKIYKLCVSYDEAGAGLRRKVADEIRGGSGFVWQASFRRLEAADLPPGDGSVWVYPVFMQSGRTVTEALPELLRSLYADRSQRPELEFKPVWGARRGWVPCVAKALQKDVERGASLLVVAHGVTGRELPPEPSAFLNYLKVLLPRGTETALAYFGASPAVGEVLPHMKGNNVVVLPFLVGEGKHVREDMPAAQLAAGCGKELNILPPLGAFYLQAEREYRKKSFTEEADSSDREDWEKTYALYLHQLEEVKPAWRQICGYGVEREGAAAVLDRIRKAFAGVELGGGVGLLQANYRDTEVLEEVSRRLAARDERHDWTKLTDEALNCCFAALSFTDAEGYRFLAPAFMCCHLRGRLRSCISFTCSEDVAEWCLKKTALLNEEQRRAMEFYVDFYRSCGEGDGSYRKLPWQWK